MQPFILSCKPIYSLSKYFVYLQDAEEDSGAIVTLKEIVGGYLDAKFQPHMLHKVAVFLNPRQKTMRVLSARDRASVIRHIEQMIENLPLRAHLPPQHDHPAGNPPPAKRSRYTIDEFDDVAEEEDESELQQYQQMKGSDQLPLLQWWRKHATVFPALATVARKVMAVMATSAASERNFSQAGIIVDERRSNLSPCSVDNILFLNSARRAVKD